MTRRQRSCSAAQTCPAPTVTDRRIEASSDLLKALDRISTRLTDLDQTLSDSLCPKNGQYGNAFAATVSAANEALAIIQRLAETGPPLEEAARAERVFNHRALQLYQLAAQHCAAEVDLFPLIRDHVEVMYLSCDPGVPEHIRDWLETPTRDAQRHLYCHQGHTDALQEGERLGKRFVVDLVDGPYVGIVQTALDQDVTAPPPPPGRPVSGLGTMVMAGLISAYTSVYALIVNASTLAACSAKAGLVLVLKLFIKLVMMLFKIIAFGHKYAWNVLGWLSDVGVLSMIMSLRNMHVVLATLFQSPLAFVGATLMLLVFANRYFSGLPLVGWLFGTKMILLLLGLVMTITSLITQPLMAVLNTLLTEAPAPPVPVMFLETIGAALMATKNPLVNFVAPLYMAIPAAGVAIGGPVGGLVGAGGVYFGGRRAARHAYSGAIKMLSKLSVALDDAATIGLAEEAVNQASRDRPADVGSTNRFILRVLMLLLAIAAAFDMNTTQYFTPYLVRLMHNIDPALVVDLLSSTAGALPVNMTAGTQMVASAFQALVSMF